MEHFHIYQPVAKGKCKPDKIEIFIGLLSFGEENAIKRSDLAAMCVGAGLIDKDCKDKDRSMRRLLERARRDYVILNDCKGLGYYRPTPKELSRLARSNTRERGRAIEVFKSTKMSCALEDDYKHDRMLVQEE